MRIHNCRHTFAAHAVMSVLDLYTFDSMLGHAHIPINHLGWASTTLIGTALASHYYTLAWLT